MTCNSPDSYKISLNIIKAVKQHPILYIPEIKGSSVKPQEFRQKVWKRISSELGLDPSWVKLKWKNLRDTYCRILRYKDKYPKGFKKRKWIFEDHLDFLKIPYQESGKYIELSEDYIKDINTEVVRSQEYFLDQLESVENGDDDDDDYDDYLEMLESGDSILESPCGVQKKNIIEEKKGLVVDGRIKQCQIKLKRVKPKRKKLDKMRTIEAASNLVLKLPEQGMPGESRHFDPTYSQDSFDYDTSIDEFFRNIAQNVKKLPPKVQAEVKMDVCKIVSEAEISHLSNNALQRVKKYSNMPGMIQKLVLVPCHRLDRQIKVAKV